MTIKAEVILDSVGPNGVRLTTMALTYPRMVHAEVMTHRVFSRNASSSRAIPVKRLIDMAIEDPAFFESVRYNEPGMQGQMELTAEDLATFRIEWETLMHHVADVARRWAAPKARGGLNIHKQHVNRVMEPWHHIKVVVTATEWDNFFNLRCHEAAEPTMYALAMAMKEAHTRSVPTELKCHEWHLPWIRDDERKVFTLEAMRKISAARCARVSYMRHDGEPSPYADDIDLHDRLVIREKDSIDPQHMSPVEHQAQALPLMRYTEHYDADGNRFYISTANDWSGNLRGWKQYRKVIEQGVPA